MIDADAIGDWFCREMLPLEPALTRDIRPKRRAAGEVFDLPHEA